LSYEIGSSVMCTWAPPDAGTRQSQSR